jgi:hypothetical protein
MRPMTSSVSCVSCSTPPPCPSVATSPSTAARGSRKTRRKLIRVLTATMTGPQPSSQRPTTLRAHLGQVTATSAGDQARFSPADGPSSTAKTRDYTQHRGVPSPPAVARRRPPACWSSRKLRRVLMRGTHPQLSTIARTPATRTVSGRPQYRHDPRPVWRAHQIRSSLIVRVPTMYRTRPSKRQPNVHPITLVKVAATIRPPTVATEHRNLTQVA